MKDKRREILLGYLLGALEPHETAKVDAELESSERLRQDLADVCREISPINEIVDCHEPPPGLAERTCRKLWEKIDSPATENRSETKIAPSPPTSPRKKRRATAIFVQNTTPETDPAEISPDAEMADVFDTKINFEDEPHNVPIPLSRAVRMAMDGGLRDPSLSSVKPIRRVDAVEPTPAKPELHRIFAETSHADRGQQPKYYGRNAAAKVEKRPWTIRDVFASLLVGLTAAVLIFPAIRMGIGNFRDMVVQKKLQTVAQNMAPNTSQYSPYGLSAGDLRALAGMNIDPHSATLMQAQRVGITGSLNSPPTVTETAARMPTVVPVSLSVPQQAPLLAASARPLQIIPDFLIVVDGRIAVSQHMFDDNLAPFLSCDESCPLHDEPLNRDAVDILLIRELVNRSNLALSDSGDILWHSPGCDFTQLTSAPNDASFRMSFPEVVSSSP